MPLLGTADDMHCRHELRRKDSIARKGHVMKARKRLFAGHALSGKKVQKTLVSDSSVPVEVRNIELSSSLPSGNTLNICILERLLECSSQIRREFL